MQWQRRLMALLLMSGLFAEAGASPLRRLRLGICGS